MAETLPTLACIGSFRRDSHLAVMQQTIDACAAQGIHVTNPLSTMPLNPGELFARFPEDDDLLRAAGIELTNPHVSGYIESLALGRILRADAVYVVCPDAHVGNTTAYELAHVIDARRPTYFSAHPDFDWYPVPQLLPGRIVTPDALAALVLGGNVEPLPDYFASMRG